jgi:hypothetical protein
MMKRVEKTLWIVKLVSKLYVVTIVDVFSEGVLVVWRGEVSCNAGERTTWSIRWTNYSRRTKVVAATCGCALKSTSVSKKPKNAHKKQDINKKKVGGSRERWGYHVFRGHPNESEDNTDDHGEKHCKSEHGKHFPPSFLAFESGSADVLDAVPFVSSDDGSVIKEGHSRVGRMAFRSVVGVSGLRQPCVRERHCVYCI